MNTKEITTELQTRNNEFHEIMPGKWITNLKEKIEAQINLIDENIIIGLKNGEALVYYHPDADAEEFSKYEMLYDPKGNMIEILMEHGMALRAFDEEHILTSLDQLQNNGYVFEWKAKENTNPIEMEDEQYTR